MVGEAILVKAAQYAVQGSEGLGFFNLVDAVAAAPVSAFRTLAEKALPSVVFHRGAEAAAVSFGRAATLGTEPVPELVSLIRSTPKFEALSLKTPLGLEANMQSRLGEKISFRLTQPTQEGVYGLKFDAENGLLKGNFPRFGRGTTSHVWADLEQNRLTMYVEGLPQRVPLGVPQEIGHKTTLTMHTPASASVEMPGLTLNYTNKGMTASVMTSDRTRVLKPLQMSFDAKGEFQNFLFQPHGERFGSIRYDRIKGISEINVPRDPYVRPNWQILRTKESY